MRGGSADWHLLGTISLAEGRLDIDGLPFEAFVIDIPALILHLDEMDELVDDGIVHAAIHPFVVGGLVEDEDLVGLDREGIGKLLRTHPPLSFEGVLERF